MKKILLFLMLAVIVTLTSCSEQDELTTDGGGEMHISFELTTDAPWTRTGGSFRYIMEVYEGMDVSGVSIQHIEQSTGEFSLSLEKNKKYVCLFWADAVALNDTMGVYNASSLKDVRLNSGKVATEAFFASQLVESNAANDYPIVLKRAVAQVNIIEKETVLANTDIKATFERYMHFNAFSGEVAGETVQFTKTFNSEAVTATLGTLLTFASVDGIMTDFSLVYGEGSVKKIPEVPLKANVITNISGKLNGGSVVNLTEINIPDANFKAYLVEEFDTDGNGEISNEECG